MTNVYWENFGTTSRVLPVVENFVLGWPVVENFVSLFPLVTERAALCQLIVVEFRGVRVRRWR